LDVLSNCSQKGKISTEIEIEVELEAQIQWNRKTQLNGWMQSTARPLSTAQEVVSTASRELITLRPGSCKKARKPQGRNAYSNENWKLQRMDSLKMLL